MEEPAVITLGVSVVTLLVFFGFVLPRIRRDRARWLQRTPEEQQRALEQAQRRRARLNWIDTGVKILGGGLLIGLASVANLWNSSDQIVMGLTVAALICAGGIALIIYGLTRPR